MHYKKLIILLILNCKKTRKLFLKLFDNQNTINKCISLKCIHEISLKTLGNTESSKDWFHLSKRYFYT